MTVLPSLHYRAIIKICNPNWQLVVCRVSSRGGGGGEASPPNCPTSPPKEKEKEREKGERERERGRGREREREREMGESIYLGIMIHVSNTSLIITNIKLMYKNTLCTHGGQLYVKVPHPLLPQIKFSG